MTDAREGDAGLFWTGHALVDVGIAGLCAFSKVDRPELLSLAHLDAASGFMEKTYYGKAELLGTYLSCVFMNASFVQPNEGKAKRAAFIARYLHAHRADPDPRVAGSRCVFTGLPAISPLVRTHLPLFSGEDVLNFRPNAQTWIPTAGPVVVAVMFLPLAGRRAEGRMLVVHADHSRLTLEFARRYLEDNRRLLAMPLPTERLEIHPQFEREQPMWDPQKGNKFADVKGPRSLVVADLSEIAGRAAGSWADPTPTALTAYLVSNGQKPSLDIVNVPAGAVSFVRKASTSAETRPAWNALTSGFRPSQEPREAERQATGRAKRRKAPVAGRPGWSRNPAFEQLCEVFSGGFTDRVSAHRWLGRYVLGRRQAAGRQEIVATGARSWSLANLFLQEVLGMKAARIDAIRSFADKLADHIARTNDRKLYRSLVFDRPYEVRSALMSAQRRTVPDRLLFGLNEFATVWLHEDGDEFLVRDLISIRVVERLSEAGYFRENPEDVIEPEPAPAE
jgi:CRISPR-associated protein Cst1